MKDLYAGIDLDTTTTSMTINSPAAVIMAKTSSTCSERCTAEKRLAT